METLEFDYKGLTVIAEVSVSEQREGTGVKHRGMEETLMVKKAKIQAYEIWNDKAEEQVHPATLAESERKEIESLIIEKAEL